MRPRNIISVLLALALLSFLLPTALAEGAEEQKLEDCVNVQTANTARDWTRPQENPPVEIMESSGDLGMAVVLFVPVLTDPEQAIEVMASANCAAAIFQDWVRTTHERSQGCTDQYENDPATLANCLMEAAVDAFQRLMKMFHFDPMHGLDYECGLLPE